ncbi:hypothetical protein F4778DRAFT_241218 [Xylariomycetidae sp. FL2044]|nr:hypothetical protein F4778DRAFT_241218 [Xylariomycetidae sp. FL2044]
MAPALDPSRHPAYAAECGDPSRTKKLGFGKRPAVLLLDVCEAYILPTSPLVLSPDTVECVTRAISTLLAAARATVDEGGSAGDVAQEHEAARHDGGRSSNVPVIYAQTLYTHPRLRDAGLQVLKTSQASLFHTHDPANLTALPATAEYAELQARSDDLRLCKKYPSPFFGTNFATQLTALGWTR